MFPEPLEAIWTKSPKEKPETLQSCPVAKVLENGLMECWVCKIALKDEAELKKHVFSSLHKENAKTHCIYRRFKEQSPSRKRDDTVFKTPDPRISPRITGKKQVGSITDASSQMVTIKAKSPSPV
eukprot:TRINITY_DN4541_c0_g1_i8.p2 TRINITY_DN4541_c0_g1~~TRINITY_DN4541_c0_g1_i8.p2  ORF type:complete len:125 (-),score=25.90 TRINITY_DN4541_c0_g1_i8:289-663(-)